MPDSYPPFTNGGEKPDERPQEGFAKRASLLLSFLLSRAGKNGHRLFSRAGGHLEAPENGCHGTLA